MLVCISVKMKNSECVCMLVCTVCLLGEKLGVETWLLVAVYPVKSSSCGAFTEGTTTEGMGHSEI